MMNGNRPVRHSVLEVLLVSLKLGLLSFGGPIAHLGYFHAEYVKQRQWMDERRYADLVALCQFLPGPASSQVGMGIGMIRAGIPGALAAWIGFTLPSALLLAAFAYLFQKADLDEAGWIHGLKLAAVAVVAQAVYSMGRSLANDRPRATIAIAAALAVMAWHHPLAQIVAIALAAAAGLFLCRETFPEQTEQAPASFKGSRKFAVSALAALAALLILLPLLRRLFPDSLGLAVFDGCFRSGSLVFGGGHVVLPLLEQEVVPPGWVTPEQFLAGYGAAQAVPGPLFTFASYLGAMIGGWPLALLATIAIFLPAFLLVAGILPFWDRLRGRQGVQAALRGVNAAVVGILLAALYDPIWTSAVRTPADFSLTLATFALLTIWKLPPWTGVLFAALGGTAIAVFS